MSVLASSLFKDIFSTRGMREIFSDQNLVQCWLRAEVALARAEAMNGIVPSSAADEIERKAEASNLSVDLIREGIATTWHPLLPMIEQLSRACEEPHGEYVHWGATTQDIMDTGLMLQMRAGLAEVRGYLGRLIGELERLATEHKGTIMAGRTHGQQGLPLTFGYKVSVWLSEYRRHLERFDEIARRCNTGNLSGGVGTLASLGDKAGPVRRDYFMLLGMDEPDVTWHAARDRISEVLAFLALVGSTNAKIANEIAQLQRTEIGELEEPFYHGKVGSSTMPQKRNPIASETIVALGHLLRGSTSTGQLAMFAEHERDMRLWMLEWDAVGSAFCFASGSLNHLEWILSGLIVRADRMRVNLDASQGLIMAEPVFMKLSESLGHQTAHTLVYEAAMAAYESGRPFGEVLRDIPEIRQHLHESEVDDLFDPVSYLGLTGSFVDGVVAGDNGPSGH